MGCRLFLFSGRRAGRSRVWFCGDAKSGLTDIGATLYRDGQGGCGSDERRAGASEKDGVGGLGRGGSRC